MECVCQLDRTTGAFANLQIGRLSVGDDDRSGKSALISLFGCVCSQPWTTKRSCFLAKGEERVPLFGDWGLVCQFGNVSYTRPRKFREKV
jgi:hypothetical protein